MTLTEKIISELEPFDLDIFKQVTTASISTVALVSGTTYRITFTANISGVNAGMYVTIEYGDNDGTYKIDAVSTNYVDVTSDTALTDQKSSAIIYSVKTKTINSLISKYTTYVENFTGISFSGTVQRDEYHDGGTNEIILDRKDVQSVDNISVIGYYLDYAYQSNNIDLLPGTGIIRLKGNYTWPMGYNNIKVTYTTGYASLPDDISTAITYLVCSDSLGKEAGQSGSPTSLSVVAYSESFGEMGQYADARKSYRKKANSILRKYRTGVIG